MATTKSNFALAPTGALTAAAVGGTAVVKALSGDVAAAHAVTLVDQADFDLAKAGLAKNGCAYIELTGTTAVDLDLTDLTATGVTSSAGDTTFAKWNQLIFRNVGTTALVISSGASNGATLPLAGTTPTLSIPAGKRAALEAATAGVTVDSTHKIITITPTSGGKIAVSVGGA